MENTTNFKFEQLNEKVSNQPEEGEFQECNFPRLKSVNSEKETYLFYGTDEMKKVQADTAYEAVHKVNLKNIKKMVCMDNILGTKNIFTPEELKKDKTKVP